MSHCSPSATPVSVEDPTRAAHAEADAHVHHIPLHRPRAHAAAAAATAAAAAATAAAATAVGRAQRVCALPRRAWRRSSLSAWASASGLQARARR
jgi:hypothetical protein